METPDFNAVFGGSDGNSLPFDDQKLLRQIATIAFPGTKFELIEHISTYIYHVRSQEYPHPLAHFYADIRFLEEVEESSPERQKTLAPGHILLEQLEHLLGTAYVWGGNWHHGIPEMTHYYPPQIDFGRLDRHTQQTWLLQGVDCSGLLFEVTSGITPRCTAALVDYGHPVPIQGKSQKEIEDSLEPLDLIVWKGHVLVVIEGKKVIESRSGKGVIKTMLKECLDEILSTRTPVDDWSSNEDFEKRFVVRRWNTSQVVADRSAWDSQNIPPRNFSRKRS